MNPERSSRCSECQVYEPIFIHNVRHGNAFRSLCTSCVLKLNVKSFCPICLEMYHVCPSIDCVKCQKCSFHSHKSCLSTHETLNYICCSCLNPNSFFDIGSSIDVDTRNCDKRFLDFNKSKALLLATNIALNSMNRALTTSRVDSERKTKESILTKKKAKEAIDKVFTSVLEEKEQSEQEALERLKTDDGCKEVLDSSVQKKKLKKVDPAFLAALESQRRIQECPKVEEKKINTCFMDDSNEDGFRELEELLGVSVPKTDEKYLVNDSEIKKGSVLKNPQVENIIRDDIVSKQVFPSSEKKNDIEIDNGKLLNGCPDL